MIIDFKSMLLFKDLVIVLGKINGHLSHMNGHGCDRNERFCCINNYGCSINGHLSRINDYGYNINEHLCRINGHGCAINEHLCRVNDLGFGIDWVLKTVSIPNYYQ